MSRGYVVEGPWKYSSSRFSARSEKQIAQVPEGCLRLFRRLEFLSIHPVRRHAPESKTRPGAYRFQIPRFRNPSPRQLFRPSHRHQGPVGPQNEHSPSPSRLLSRSSYGIEPTQPSLLNHLSCQSEIPHVVRFSSRRTRPNHKLAIAFVDSGHNELVCLDSVRQDVW